MTNEIFGKIANYENLQAPEIEELDDSQVSTVVGGILAVVDGVVDYSEDVLGDTEGLVQELIHLGGFH